MSVLAPDGEIGARARAQCYSKKATAYHHPVVLCVGIAFSIEPYLVLPVKRFKNEISYKLCKALRRRIVQLRTEMFVHIVFCNICIISED